MKNSLEVFLYCIANGRITHGGKVSIKFPTLLIRSKLKLSHSWYVHYTIVGLLYRPTGLRVGFEEQCRLLLAVCIQNV